MLACVAVTALAACGGDDEETGALGSALAYLPKETPFAVAIDTNLDGDQYKSLDAILAKFPVDAPSLKDLLRDVLIATGSGLTRVERMFDATLLLESAPPHEAGTTLYLNVDLPARSPHM